MKQIIIDVEKNSYKDLNELIMKRKRRYENLQQNQSDS